MIRLHSCADREGLAESFALPRFRDLCVWSRAYVYLCEAPGQQLRVPGFPYTPIVFLLLTAFMLALLASRSPRQALLGVLVVSIGLPAFQLVRKAKMARAKG